MKQDNNKKLKEVSRGVGTGALSVFAKSCLGLLKGDYLSNKVSFSFDVPDKRGGGVIEVMVTYNKEK